MNEQLVCPDELLKQKEWESECINRGVERYWRSQNRTIVSPDGSTKTEAIEIGETQAGSRLLSGMLGLLIPRIKELQLEAIEGLSNSGRGQPPQWWWYIAWLPAEKVSYITIRAVLAEKVHTADRGRKFTPTALRVGQTLKEELEFDRWRYQSKENAKAGNGPDLASALIAAYKGPVNRRAFARWKAKCAQIEQEDWTSDVKIQVGAACLLALTESCPQFIQTSYAIARGKTERILKLSEEALQALCSIHETLEVRRPYLMPTLVPPKPWTRNAELDVACGPELQ